VRADGAPLGQREAGADEAGALRAALAAADRQLSKLAAAAGKDAAEILEFQIALLADDALLGPIFAAIAQGAAADAAWAQAMAEQIADYRAAADEYLRARSADIADLRDRVLSALYGGEANPKTGRAGAVICADDLPPSRFLEIDWSAGGGLALSQGSATSHVAMLARARGVPMVVQLGEVPEPADAALLDADEGILEVDPPVARIQALATRQENQVLSRAADLAALENPSISFRGEPVRLMLNIQGPADLDHPDARYADGVGLMRTEFLFGRADLPDEEKQRSVYEQVLNWAGERPVVIRTVDAGGDKPVRGLTEAREANPFLGVRGLRLSLKRPDIFAVQLRALARAAALGKLRVMFPMVTTPEEFKTARRLFVQAVEELKSAGVRASLPEIGIMVEVPAAALTIESFPASFFSIGSNDLTQYVTACDRTNGALASLADPLNPGVLELIRRVAEHGRKLGVSVSLCGDIAGEPRYLETLLRCGLREFSMSPPALAAVKRALAALSRKSDHV